jgi:hypothetical protein
MSQLNKGGQSAKPFVKGVTSAKQIADQKVLKAAGEKRADAAVEKINQLKSGPQTKDTGGMIEAQKFNGSFGLHAAEKADKKISQLSKNVKPLTGNKMGSAKANSPSPTTMQPKQGAKPAEPLSAPAPKILGAQPAPQRLPTPSGAKPAATLTGAPKQGANPGTPLSAPAKKTLSPQPAPQRIPTPSAAKPATPTGAQGGTAFKPGAIRNPNRVGSPKIGNKG